MKKNVMLAAFACAAVMLVGLPDVRADEWDQKTVFTFNEAVEIPGQVLAPGTYVFKLADSPSDRNIVQVYNKDEDHLYGTFLTIPDYRLQPTGKTFITFEERAAGNPEAVRAWFYPGEDFGHDFVYPKSKASELAQINNTPVPSMPNELATNTTKPATTMQEPHILQMKEVRLKAQQPTEDEVEIAEAFAVPDAAPPATGVRTELPQTAGSMPLIGLLGLLALGTAGALWGAGEYFKHRS